MDARLTCHIPEGTGGVMCIMQVKVCKRTLKSVIGAKAVSLHAFNNKMLKEWILLLFENKKNFETNLLL